MTIRGWIAKKIRYDSIFEASMNIEKKSRGHVYTYIIGTTHDDNEILLRLIFSLMLSASHT